MSFKRYWKAPSPGAFDYEFVVETDNDGATVYKPDKDGNYVAVKRTVYNTQFYLESGILKEVTQEEAFKPPAMVAEKPTRKAKVAEKAVAETAPAE